jgi:alkylated DNA repair dioxygenase AlkB
LVPKTYSKRKGGRVNELGAGDTSLVLDFLPADEASAIFAALLPHQAVYDEAFMQVCDEAAVNEHCKVRWQEMYYHGQPVPRLVCIQAKLNRDGARPMYRHPVDSQPSIYELSPAVQRVVEGATNAFGYQFNHVLIQLYRSGQDSISPHTDKTLDIAHGTPIVNVSFGASRSFLMRSKSKLACGTGRDTSQNVALLHNSALSFGLETNRLFTHQIEADKRSEGQRRSDERSWGGVRVSLTLRVVATFQRPDGRLYGQGARHKTEEALDQAIAAGQTEAGLAVEVGLLELSEQMAEAFRQENKDPDFDWKTNYGDGFDLLAPITYASTPSLAAGPEAMKAVPGNAEGQTWHLEEECDEDAAKGLL